MKITSILLLFVIAFSLNAFTIKSKTNTTELEHTALQKMKQVKIETVRNKKGKISEDEWEGVLVKDLLKGYDNFNEAIFTSTDNYLTRLSKDQLLKDKVIIALKRNGQHLNKNKMRLIVPNIRDMYWISRLEKIELVESTIQVFPRAIKIAETILANKPMRKELKPFSKHKGYYFADLVTGQFANSLGEYLLIGRDGIKHRLNYNKYLADAILVYDEKKQYYMLKSPSFPVGMWIKDVVFVQNEEEGIIFLNKYLNWEDVKTSMGWTKIPPKMTIIDELGSRDAKTNKEFFKRCKKIIKFIW